MASVNWDKQTKQKAAAMKKHNGQRERMEYNHSNPDIDKTRTPDNYCIGCDDYNDAYEAMVKRVEEIDKEFPPEKIKSDRKICCSLETKCPLEITEAGRSREFFEAIHEVMVDFFGAENTHGACVHLDEVHDYVDGETGEIRRSLEHSTELVSCYVEWRDPVWLKDENGKNVKELAFDKQGKPLLDKDGNQKLRNVQARDENGALLWRERKGINGKNFETRSAMKELNKRVCDMVRERFGVEYNTGEQAKGQSVETLKAQTAERTQEKKLLDKVADFVSGKGAKKVATAEQIIDNANKVNKAICHDNELERQQLAKDRRRLEADKAQALKEAQSLAEQRQALEKDTATLKAGEKQLKSGWAKLQTTIDGEVQRRLARTSHFSENEKYKELCYERQRAVQQAAERAARKRKGERER